MSDEITDWLEQLELGDYAEVFAANAIDMAVLPHLDDDDLKELGLLLGHRRKLLAAARALGDTPLRFHEAETSDPEERTTPDREAERRQLTVMFSDLVDSTQLSQRLDPEELREINIAYQDACKTAIERYEGYVARYMGDGVLAYFGFPQAHEDDAERAVLSGLDLIEDVRSLGERMADEHGVELAVRVGVATGPVVVGDLIGEGASQEAAVVGETPNLAARLQSFGTANSVLVSPGTHRLAGDRFRYEALGERFIKGIDEPVELWRVSGTRTWSSRFRAHGDVGTARLVGRDQELALLLNRWSQASEGEGQVVLLSGEPGIGKSRLTDTVLTSTTTDASSQLIYQCSPYYTHSALYPVIAQLVRAAGLADDESDDTKLDRLESLINPLTNVTVDRPLLAELLSIPWEHRYERLNLTPEARREETLRALVRQLDGLCRDLPVVMLFEDAHWADATSIDFLDRVINWVQRSSILVMITFRPEFVVPWRHHYHVTSLTLNRLSRKLAAEMIDELSGDERISGTVREEIIAKTDGIPLFVEELTQSVAESRHSSVESEDASRVLKTSFEIPSTLQDSLASRLDRIGPAKEILQVGAVIGRDFSQALVGSLGEYTDETVTNALEMAVAAGVVFRQDGPSGSNFTFKHALVRDAAYEMLLNSRRRHLHGRLADLLESGTGRGGSSDQPELLAHHLTEAGRIEPAVDSWLRAGNAAIDRYANEEAIGHFRKGLALVDELPEGSPRDRRELDLLIGLGHGLQGSARSAVPEVGTVYRRAGSLVGHAGDARKQSEILQGLRMFHLTRGELISAGEVGSELLSLGERLRDTGLVMEGHRALGGVYLHQGQPESARTHLEAAYRLYDPVAHSGHALEYDTDPGVTALQYLSQTLWALGWPQQARDRIEDALALARDTAHPLSQIEAYFWENQLALCVRDPPRVRERAEEQISRLGEHGLQLYVGLARYHLGWAMVHMGEVEAGVNEMRRGYGAVTSIAHALMSLWSAPLVEVFEISGLIEEGLSLADEGLEAVEKAGGGLYEAELHRLKGKLLLARGDEPNDVDACLQQSLEIARRQGARAFELRGATTLARSLCDRGQAREARDLLESVYDWFTEGLDTPDLREAKALIEELS